MSPPRNDLFNEVSADRQLRSSLNDNERAAVDLLGVDLRSWIATVNEGILDRELQRQKPFFDKVEKSPLTAQQSRAVASFDNRVHVVAAAGSGKTSVMVARAAYAVRRGLVPADRILLLAFNKNAAAELQERVDEHFAAVGLDSSGVRASTFHSFGLSVIGEARGKKPRLAPWLGSGEDVEMVLRIVDELRERSSDFRFKWDIFRLLYARMAEKPDGGEADSYDRRTRTTGSKTFAGETVKSQGERLVADWLYLNGVRYYYERAYVHDTADVQHSQYRPDFYYPDLDVWHEHWAVDKEGRIPATFSGYAKSMVWKRATHRRFGTTLLETTWAGVMDRTGLDTLAEELKRHGAVLDWNPHRPTPGPGRSRTTRWRD